MAPGSSNSSAALSSNADFYSNDHSFFIDGVEHQYRELDLPAEDSRIPVRPPFLAASDFHQEWRYTIPDEIKPDCIASGASRGLPIRRRTTTARPSFSPVADIIDVTGDDVPDRIFPQYMDADQVLESYGRIDFVSSHSLMGRAFTHVVAYEDLAVGNMVISFNAFNGNCGTGQAGAGGGTWYGDRASPTGGNGTNADVVSRTPGFSQQKVRNVRIKEYAVVTCIVDSGNITSGSYIAPEGPSNIVSAITICGTSI